ncbi:hypothetical protein [Campylobacter sp.]|uniref:hypothetical protein n=1 Tax=Campylobacter sp. TaxID=205 RepID=UPI002AA6080F|nr:hypothetical protein [Campylobacter sp.]MCI6662010.1 hypothetical protein [Campylobacter sp.]
MFFKYNIFKSQNNYFFEILAKVAGVELQALLQEYKEWAGDKEDMGILADVLNYLTQGSEEFSEFCMGYHENGEIYVNTYRDQDGGQWLYYTYNPRLNALNLKIEMQERDKEFNPLINSFAIVYEQSTKDYLSQADKELGYQLLCA